MNVSENKSIMPLNLDISSEEEKSAQEKNDLSVENQHENKNSMSEFEFRSERYNMSWLSYGTMIADTVEEGIACSELNSNNCLKIACISRARRTLGFPVLAIFGIAHSCFSFLRCLLDFSIASAVCMSTNGSSGEESVEGNDEQNGKNFRHLAFSLACAECGYSYKFCRECTYVALCCIPNACLPEVLDICGQPKVFKKIEVDLD